MERNGNGHINGTTNGHSDVIEQGGSIHLLIVPMVQQAHTVTGFRFARKLSKRGVTATMVLLKQHADELYRLYTREGLQKLRINFEIIDSYQPPQIPTPLRQSAAFRVAFQPIAQSLIAKKLSGLPGPTCVLADRFLWWIEDAVKELDIPRYSFASNAGLTIRLMQTYHENQDELRAIPVGPDWFEKCFKVIRKQPGLEFLKKASDLPGITIESGWFDFYCNIGRSFLSADGIVFNSFASLEHETIQYIGNAYPDSNVKVPALYPIGPLSTVEEFNNETFVGGMEDSHTECLEWLGTQPSESVLYICLGSQVRLFGEQISVIARALDASQQRFLWVLSKGRGNFNTVDEVLPEGYLERVCGRGKIVSGWVGQLEILSNPAIGGFLSHCGWQSVIESLTCGVPILGWPHLAEQSLNCRYIQDVMQVGMRITEKASGEIVQQDEFEEAIKSIMSGEGRTVIASNAAKMKATAAAAVAQGGSSDISLDHLVQSFSRQRRRD